MRMPMMVAVACAAALALAACTGGGAGGGGGTQPTPASQTPTPAPAAHLAALEKHADGTADAWGYVTRMQLEGGFWALVKVPPYQKGLTAGGNPTIVVLLPGAVSDAAIAGNQNTFVHVTGKLATGPSIRMAGPEMTVDTIEPATPKP